MTLPGQAWLTGQSHCEKSDGGETGQRPDNKISSLFHLISEFTFTMEPLGILGLNRNVGIIE